MSMQDPISDLLTRIRNGQCVRKQVVRVPASKQKEQILKLLKDEGYIVDYQKEQQGLFNELVIQLKYFENAPVIEMIKRVSRPGLRIYKSRNELPRVKNGLGVAVISTSKGLLTDRAARAKGVGGEVLCYVS